jgi:hypothetical protein
MAGIGEAPPPSACSRRSAPRLSTGVDLRLHLVLNGVHYRESVAGRLRPVFGHPGGGEGRHETDIANGRKFGGGGIPPPRTSENHE